MLRWIQTTHQNGYRTKFSLIFASLKFFLTRHRNENVYEMTIKTFEVATDPSTGLKYVYKAQDQLDKSHRADTTDIVSVIMPVVNYMLM